MVLSRSTLTRLNSNEFAMPADQVFGLPEKVLQFGTGVLLRGLVDFYIDKANRQGIFNGRVVMVKSTQHGDTTSYGNQNGLYNICLRGISNGQIKEENIICSAISRVLSAHDEWQQILTCAQNPEMKIIVSNTTEAGIAYEAESIFNNPPQSFPGKLLSFLWKRYEFFQGAADAGMVIIPTELIENNADQLKAIVLQLAAFNQLDKSFVHWLTTANHFCNSLVDRIVPGSNRRIQEVVESKMGLKDDLLLVSETFSLWAIECPDAIQPILSFANADNGIVLTQDIQLFKELKLRLLNATHTLSAALAMVAGIKTVKEAMADSVIGRFIAGLVKQDIATAIPYPIPANQKEEFGNAVLERFKNPFIEHQWVSITLNYTFKLKARVVPLLLHLAKNKQTIPFRYATAFAAYLVLLQGKDNGKGQFVGNLANYGDYEVKDNCASIVNGYWQQFANAPEQLVLHVLGDKSLWGTDLSAIDGLAASVTEKLLLVKQGLWQEACLPGLLETVTE